MINGGQSDHAVAQVEWWGAVDWVDVLSTQSTSDPDVVNGIRESMEI